MSVTELRVNGEKHRLDTDPTRPLLSVLRDDLDLTGCKYGCGEGRCGACTVVIDGKAKRSCVTELGHCGDRSITTVEGLERDGKLHPVQQAFLDAGSMQCGYCTPGMIMSSVALLDSNPEPTADDVVRALAGNVCRCGTYARILVAVRKAATALKGGGK
jgi:aerobic-type carbon monoxide dehydrogenase small subunit (CoxS/CutS family)